LFLLSFSARYLRVFIGFYAYTTCKPYPVKDRPKFNTRDTTVVVPTTFKDEREITKCLECIHACSPERIIIVTANANTGLVRELCRRIHIFNVEVLGVEKLNKRDQMIKALQHVHTGIVVFADDDVFWPDQYLRYLLAIFENPKAGAGGTRQRVRRNAHPNIWNLLGISYLERRVWNNICTNAVDGSVSTLSGRTAAYRTKILKDNDFFEYFTTDSWLGRKLNTDDDKCLTRYVYSHGWDIVIQSDPRSIIQTTLEDNPKYIAQCNRWARAHWRGNFTVMTNESYWRSDRYWWGFLVIYLCQFQTPALLVDGSMMTLLSIAIQDNSGATRLACFTAFCLWVLFTKTMKMVPHFCRHPQDLIFLPALWCFSYLHGFINIYALCTLHNTLWGSQKLDEL
ncbi:glycosyltransferase family 2 protein, partial [Polychaeton citri CBS 116435]